MRSFSFAGFGHDHAASAAVVFGLTAPALIALTGLVIDFAGVLAAKTKLELSADSGTLASIMTAASALQSDPDNYVSDGVTAGESRFSAQAGSISTVSTPVVSIRITRTGNTLTATTNWSAAYKPFFGRMFGVTSWPLRGSAKVTSQLPAPYLNVTVLLDNSPSMEIGATNSDITILQQLTPCATGGSSFTTSPGAVYNGKTPASGQTYNAYKCSSSGHNYSGSLPCPIPAQSPYTFNFFQPSNNNGGPSCQGYLGVQTSGKSSGQYPQAGAPCAFACHFDTSKPAGQGNDYYGIARSTIGQPNQVTLRFDVVKSAVNTLITTMQNNDLAIKNLKIGIFTFDQNLTQVYPNSGEAGDDWGAATAAVGGPPTVANGTDTGIQPYGGDNGGDTNVNAVINQLKSRISVAGDGTTADAPRKVLFLITDGVVDFTGDKGRTPTPVDPADCDIIKALGYSIYVLYTPYYPLMNGYYLDNMTSIVENTGPGTVSGNLQACASAPQNYIQASDGPSIVAALQTFFKLASTPPARFAQ